MEMTEREEIISELIHLQVKEPMFVHNFLGSVTNGKCPS